MTNILRLNAGANHAGSVSRPLADRIISRLGEQGATTVTNVELSDGVPLVNGDWVDGANNGSDTPAAKAAVAISDAYIAQLLAADVLVISAPIYNFTLPAALKGWIDQVARAGVTFKYSGPGEFEGLVTGKKAYVVVTSGGVPLGSDFDFLSPYLRSVLGFVGITDVVFIDASGLAFDAAASIERAEKQIDELFAR
jgi:FMN-dependent NADH-azoreductase